MRTAYMISLILYNELEKIATGTRGVVCRFGCFFMQNSTKGENRFQKVTDIFSQN